MVDKQKPDDKVASPVSRVLVPSEEFLRRRKKLRTSVPQEKSPEALMQELSETILLLSRYANALADLHSLLVDIVHLQQLVMRKNMSQEMEEQCIQITKSLLALHELVASELNSPT